MEHLDADVVLAYVAERLTEAESFSVEVHLATCSECAERVNATHRLREGFDAAWDGWTAARHADAALRERLFRAVTESRVRPELRTRLEGWVARWSEVTAAAVRIALEAGERLARVATSDPRGFFPPLSLAEVGAFPRIRGQAEEGAASAVAASGEKIYVDAVHRRVVARLPLAPPPYPLAVLLPAPTSPALFTEFRHPEATDYLLAEFEDVPDGEHELILIRP